jgi:hypothetical protein
VGTSDKAKVYLYFPTADSTATTFTEDLNSVAAEYLDIVQACANGNHDAGEIGQDLDDYSTTEGGGAWDDWETDDDKLVSMLEDIHSSYPETELDALFFILDLDNPIAYDATAGYVNNGDDLTAEYLNLGDISTLDFSKSPADIKDLTIDFLQ